MNRRVLFDPCNAGTRTHRTSLRHDRQCTSQKHRAWHSACVCQSRMHRQKRPQSPGLPAAFPACLASGPTLPRVALASSYVLVTYDCWLDRRGHSLTIQSNFYTTMFSADGSTSSDLQCKVMVSPSIITSIGPSSSKSIRFTARRSASG